MCGPLTAAHRGLDPPRRLNKALVPQLEHQQRPKQLAMIRDAALVLILQARYEFRIENTRASHAFRRQQIAREWSQFNLQPLSHRHAEALLPATSHERR